MFFPRGKGCDDVSKAPRRIVGLGIAAAAALTVPASALGERAPGPAFYAALRMADLRVAAVAYRLTTANAALCRAVQPALGMPLHTLDQYGPEARAGADAAFGFETDVAVEAVVPDGPAARAGLRAGDSLMAIEHVAQPPKPAATAAAGTVAARVAAESTLAALPPGKAIALTIRRNGRDMTLPVIPVPGCRTGVELTLGPGFEADSDGEKLRISARFLEEFDDEQIAVVLAHELSHTILEHRRRLEAAGVSYGMLAEIGRNGRLWRQTEDQADQLSVYLLYNAGYDPASPVHFWRGKGARLGGGVFRSRTHAGPASRAQAMAAEAAKIAPNAPRPVVPAMLALRDAPLE